MIGYYGKYLYIESNIQVLHKISQLQPGPEQPLAEKKHETKTQKAARTVKVVPCHCGIAPLPPLGAVAISHQLLVAPPTCRMYPNVGCFVPGRMKGVKTREDLRKHL